MNRLIFLIAFLISCSDVIAQDPVSDSQLKIGGSYRIHPGNVSQTETFIARSPLDQNTFFAGCNTITFIPFFISEGIYTTNDAGTSWRGSDSCKGNPIAYHGGDPGITIDKNGTFILTRLGRSPFVGLYSHYSYDQGQTWSAQQVISTDDLERAVLISDSRPGSPGFGKTYAAWIKFAIPFPLMFAFTDDGANTWSNPKPINNPANRSAGGDLATGPDGTLYACWSGVTDVSPFKEIYVGFASSTDAGANWTVTENAFAMNGITGILSGKNNIRVNGLPSIAVDTTNGPRKGWIYVVTGQKALSPAGNDPDIILNRSTDGGQTWSQGIRVNQDPMNNGKTQYFPAIHVDRTGAINVLFYDDRNTTNDSAGVFLARSTDGGDTWREFEICDHHFRPAPIGGLGQGYQGDNIDISST
ncbi:MAG TPA: sialidase family protein, partial [Bacteroidales bacterium]|nr:sialidase family protein [Bacteroidales bacterium]